MSSHKSSCHRCGRELKGAIETNYMSLGRLVCITSIETPDCNWTRCPVCKKSVCRSCYLSIAAMCTGCYVGKQHPLKSNTVTGNGAGPKIPMDPTPPKRAA